MTNILAIILFAISSSVTPGPNNIMVMTSGVNFGVRRSIPLLSGVCIGFTIMLLLVGFGFGQIFTLFPGLHFIIKCVGTFYLIYLAWLIAKSDSVVSSQNDSKPLSFLNGALFQWVNPKAWVVATGAIAAFTTLGGNFYSQNFVIAGTFFIISFPCVAIWLLFGSVLKRNLKPKSRLKWFNYSMALLLVLSVVPAVKEIVKATIA